MNLGRSNDAGARSIPASSLRDHRVSPQPRFLPALCVSALLLLGSPSDAHANAPVFTDAFSGAAIQTPLKPGEVETAALKQFKTDGSNAYRGDKAALAQGKKLYDEWCQVCHNADASGKMGPSLVGKSFQYPQSANDVGMFSIIYAGAAGAMQAFSRREITQDEMLKVIAYIRSITPEK